MRILLATEVIHPGGAETFILRLAEALQSHGHEVRVFIFYKEMLNKQLCKLFAPNVTVKAADIPASLFFRKIDSVLFRMKVDYSFREQYIKTSLYRELKDFAPDVIHSHLLKTDKVCLSVAEKLNIPVVNTIHGDYLQFFNKTKQGIAIPLLNYRKKAIINLSKLKKVVCISDKQLAFFKEHFPIETNGKLTKIYNGYTGQIKERPEALRAQLNIPSDAMVYGMVSRGIADKGWQVAIDAFLKIGKSDAHLVLVGSSDYLTGLQAQYKAHKNIHFTGHADNPLDWINMMNVGLLPTTYPSESLPTVIIEYLCCGIPCIASNAGEIENMISYEGKRAGIITPIQDGKVSVDEVAVAMEQYYNDKNIYNEHKDQAKACYTHFDMDKCIDAYCAVYKSSKTA